MSPCILELLFTLLGNLLKTITRSIDESFAGRGFDKISFVYELFAATTVALTAVEVAAADSRWAL